MSGKRGGEEQEGYFMRDKKVRGIYVLFLFNLTYLRGVVKYRATVKERFRSLLRITQFLSTKETFAWNEGYGIESFSVYTCW